MGAHYHSLGYESNSLLFEHTYKFEFLPSLAEKWKGLQVATANLAVIVLVPWEYLGCTHNSHVFFNRILDDIFGIVLYICSTSIGSEAVCCLMFLLHRKRILSHCDLQGCIVQASVAKIHCYSCTFLQSLFTLFNAGLGSTLYKVKGVCRCGGWI